jgi:tetratricopeptide (TPR) repeat protein
LVSLKDGRFVDNATKRELKKQDQFVSLTEHGISWANHNRRSAITYVSVALAAILAIVGGYTLYQHRTAAAASDFGAAMQTYQTPVQTPGQPLPPGAKSFATEKEKATAANAQFVAVADKYGMLKAGKMSRYFAGVTYMDEGEYGSAETALKSTASSWDKDLSALGKQALAQLYQQTGRDTDAITLLNELAKGDAATVSQGMAKIRLAELYESEGKTDDAKKIYAELKDKDKDAKGDPGAAAELATEKLNPKPQGQQFQ